MYSYISCKSEHCDNLLQKYRVFWGQERLGKTLPSLSVRLGIFFGCIKSTVAIYEDTLEIAQWRNVKRMQSVFFFLGGFSMYKEYSCHILRHVRNCTVEKSQKNAISVSLQVLGFSLYKEYSRHTKSCRIYLWIGFGQKY